MIYKYIHTIQYNLKKYTTYNKIYKYIHTIQQDLNKYTPYSIYIYLLDWEPRLTWDPKFPHLSKLTQLRIFKPSSVVLHCSLIKI